VIYRVKKLIKNGIIKNFVPLLDPSKFGFMAWNVYLEFQNLDENIEGEITNYLKNKKNVWWIAQTIGKWDLIYSIYVRNIREFYNTVKKFNTKFGFYILKQSLAAHVEINMFSRGYLINDQSISTKTFESDELVKLDGTDKNILKKLAKNSRISSVDLAKSLNLTSNIVIYRIKDLLKKKVITRFRVYLDINKLDLYFFKVIIYLKNFSGSRDNELKEFCRKNGKILFYLKKIGPWMLEIELEESSYLNVNNLLKEIKQKFPDYIESYDILLIYNEIKGEFDCTKTL
jgi:DNA-binding Lrp family transcriptional regulator